MKTYSKASSFDAKIPTVITIGTFDGVHIGHRKIIERLVNSAKESNYQSALLTFFPHPRMVLQQNADLRLINTIDERKNILASTGLEHLIIHPFTRAFSRLTAQQYVEEFLIEKLNAKKIIIGYDHRFGRNRTADISDLKKYADQFNFEVEEISKQDIEDVGISSTKIRTALEDGEVEKANRYLASNFLLTGEVVRGKGMGKGFGYATANILIKEDYKLIPKKGVYIVQSNINGVYQNGMMNIGTNPTVGGTQQTIEIHFLDFDKDLYGQHLQIEVLQRIRGEVNFDSVEHLKVAMKKDELYTRDYFKSNTK
ncbi:bifunctional riboflavin kinase/FAD synthetase [Psychroflexus planctonicus]|uniref:Riboflavin biosynthesis protein n=1 Tax=Psychroflexus planctonicus TaxID=1526575 RepID=A0ABQ1SKP7_9FLAO|nr:bifunctional riboflavin kinase/FAD synthetase [Psychroflexus planctonicus]GGE41506.1 riboflavin biosynthesis protein [Psychroflexus planctonicus]